MAYASSAPVYRYGYAWLIPPLDSPMSAHGTVKAAIIDGIRLFEAGQIEAARKQFRSAAAMTPHTATTYYELGLAFHRLDELQAARRYYESAVTMRPDWPQALNNLAVVHKALGDFPAAEERFKAVLAIAPNDINALINYASQLTSIKRFAEAVAIYERLAALLPGNIDVLLNLAFTANKAHRPHQALDASETALKLDARCFDAHCHKADALFHLGRRSECLALVDALLEREPDHAGLLSLRGACLSAQGRYHEALIAYERAMASAPNNAEHLSNAGVMLNMLGRCEAALAHFERAMQLEPQPPWLPGFLLKARQDLAEWNGLDALIAHCRSCAHDGRPAVEPMIAVSWASANDQLHAARVYVETELSIRERPFAPVIREQGARCRLGYFSSDFCSHAVADLTLDLFALHDRSMFEVHAFSFGQRHDALTDEVRKNVDAFHDVSRATDDEIADLARRIGIDIAIDLNGFTQHARPRIFALRAAPAQVNFIGYPATMGAPFMDYIVADPIVIPPSHEAFYAEKIIRLPETFQPNRKRTIDNRSLSRADANLPTDAFVFCAFNAPYKILPSMFDCWMKILAAVDHAVLWLTDQGRARTRDNLCKQAEKRGIDRSRLIFAEPLPLEQHLARHRLADLFLDTAPFNGGTTASCALWAGLPILTLLGDSFAGRACASLLHTMQLPELITDNLATYQHLAIDLAHHPQHLSELRVRLARNLETAPLFDTPRYARHLDAAFAEIFKRMVAGLSPDHVNVVVAA